MTTSEKAQTRTSSISVNRLLRVLSSNIDAPRPFPLAPLLGAAALLLTTIVFAYLARTTDFGATRMTPSPAAQSRVLQLIEQDDGKLVIRDAEKNLDIKVFAKREDNFIRVITHSLTLQRKTANVPLDAPYVLSRLEDGLNTLTDTATGRVIMLSAFGPGNSQTFASLLTMETPAQ